MITEKKLLKISSKYNLIILAISLFFWFVIFNMGICHAQTQTGYRIPARLDIGGGRMTGDMWCQYGTNGVRFKIGTQAVTQVDTVGVINGTNATGLPSLDFTYGGGSMSANFNGFNAIYVAGAQVGTSGALSGKLDATNGVGTNNTFNNPTLAGLGTITASFGANGLVISPTEYAMLDGASSNIQTQINTKLSKVNEVNTYIGSVTAAGKTGTSSFSLIDGTNITSTANVTAAGGIEVTINSTGTTAVQFSQLSGVPTDNSYFKTNPPPGTISVPVSDSTGMFNLREVKGTVTVPSQIVFGSTSVKMRVQNSTGEYQTGSTTVLMLRFEGGSGTTNFIDSSGSPVIGTASGNSQISSLFPAFGTGTGYFDGISDSVGFADDQKFVIGTQSFKIDATVRMDLATDTTNYGIIGQGSDSDNHWGLYYAGPGDGIVLYSRLSGVTTSVVQGATTGWLPNTKYHIRAERHGSSSVYLSRDGVRLVSGTITDNIGNYTGTVTIGSCLLLNPTQSFKGFMDELSFDIGTAVGTPSFSIPDELNYLFITGSQSVSKVAIIIGTETATKGKNFELAPGLKTYSDDWGIRCFPEQKTIVGYLDYKQSYAQCRDIVVKKQRWNLGEGQEFLAPSIADNTTPKEIRLFAKDGASEGLSTISYLGWLADVNKGIIMELENKKTEYEGRIRQLEADVEMLKNRY